MRARFSQAFGQVIQRERKRRGLSQEKLAELADAHRNYIGYLERGERGISLDFAETLARALELPIADVVREAAAEWESVPSRRRARRRSRKRQSTRDS